MKDKETETETDRLLEALKKKRQEKAMVQFFKVPFVLVRENPVRLAYGWFIYICCHRCMSHTDHIPLQQGT
ncbi:hypothetical protein DRN80_04125 [Methanosarcinales archaeon]|nr:MAG: hypothetical protein DRN80_04125 [Methanosarcinales archaeon]